MNNRRLKLGVALGGGAARGWAHIGVLRALQKAGYEPDIVTGTSIGALVGAAVAAGELDRFEAWVRRLGLREMVSLLDIGFSGGLLKGERLMSFFHKTYADRPIQALPVPFAAVATDLHTGEEVWLKEDSLSDAVRASIALPGLMAPAIVKDRTLVDGVLVNPVPVTLARALGADVVLAVDLSKDIVGRHLRRPTEEVSRPGSAFPDNVNADTDLVNASGWLGEFPQRISARLSQMFQQEGPALPSLFGVVATSITIMQVRIGKGRLAADPPDVLVTPGLSHIGLMEFHRAAESIAAGEMAANEVIADLHACLDRGSVRTAPP